MLKIISKALNIAKTIYFNYRYLPLREAVFLPIKVRWGICTKLNRGDIIFNHGTRLKYGIVRFGFSGTPFISQNYKSNIIISGNGKLILGNNVTISEGFNIYINSAKLIIQNNTYINKNVLIQCENGIKIHENALLGWNVNIRDTDGHKLTNDNKDKSFEIHIGKNVWVASDAFLMRGTRLSNGSVVGTRSLVLGLQLTEEKCLVVGSPAIVKKRNVTIYN